MSMEESYEHYSAIDILKKAVNTYGHSITFASSFGAEDVVIIDMLNKIKPDINIFFLDTDLHFIETYETIDRLQKKYNRSFTPVKTDLSLQDQEQRYGSKLWEHNPDLCCNLRKVKPLTEHLRKFDAWITGIRREQSPTRAGTQKIEQDTRFGLIKYNPLADWTHKDVWNYIHTNNVPYNSLHDQNYPSIGCAVCTKPVFAGQDARSGRWSGFAKTECGLHR